jgi:1-acyl-sn-glycerol-3-phosphate acyltransferase
MLYHAIVFGCRAAIRLFCRTRVEVSGQENLPAEGPALLVANHASYLDPPVISIAVRRQVYFMARENLLQAPLLGPVLRRCGVFPVRPETADRNAIRHAVNLLAQGKLVCIFPEGTRSATGELQEAHPGAALIAAKARVPLIPVAIQGTWEALPREARWLRPARLSLAFGPPILPRADTEGRRATELAGTSRRIMEAIDQLLVEEREPAVA